MYNVLRIIAEHCMKNQNLADCPACRQSYKKYALDSILPDGFKNVKIYKHRWVPNPLLRH